LPSNNRLYGKSFLLKLIKSNCAAFKDFNGYLVNTIQSVPYKINNGYISLSCKTKVLNSLSQYFGSEYTLYHTGILYV
jgi:hypothetical protein